MLNDFLLLMLALPAVAVIYLASVILAKFMTSLINWFAGML